MGRSGRKRKSPVGVTKLKRRYGGVWQGSSATGRAKGEAFLQDIAGRKKISLRGRKAWPKRASKRGTPEMG